MIHGNCERQLREEVISKGLTTNWEEECLVQEE